MNGLFALAHALQHIGGEVVILHILDAALDDATEVVRLAAAGAGGKKVESTLDLGFEPDGCGHDGSSRILVFIKARRRVGVAP